MTWLETALGSISLQGGQITYAEAAWRDLNDQAWWKEDLLQVEYQGDFLLDVGWYGHEQEAGEFQVRVIRKGDWSLPAFQCSVMARNTLLPVIEQAIQWTYSQQNSLADQS
jgi:hypothetical protein